MIFITKYGKLINRRLSVILEPDLNSKYKIINYHYFGDKETSVPLLENQIVIWLDELK